jgi:hypothetical protein
MGFAAALAPAPSAAESRGPTIEELPTIEDADDARKVTVMTTATAHTRNPFAVSRK